MAHDCKLKYWMLLLSSIDELDKMAQHKSNAYQ